ncbi:nuclear transport factor 2 family protein [Halobaculum limi]|uniref:nuclear transport factor 2 family protein n=1 Tax=Halobaculum limi TaxID=3031916 RepID=UPI00240744C9|nr:nuclear transport factor 2 family protein [Halobaculum sp. YSMS11]
MATTSDPTTTQSVLNHHLDAFMDQDMTAMLEDYTEDSVVVTNTAGTFHGLDEIKSLFSALFAEFEQSNVEFTQDEEVIEDDIAYICWHAETPENTYEFATDTFVIRDGKIQTQTLGAKVTPKN